MSRKLSLSFQSLQYVARFFGGRFRNTPDRLPYYITIYVFSVSIGARSLPTVGIAAVGNTTPYTECVLYPTFLFLPPLSPKVFSVTTMLESDDTTNTICEKNSLSSHERVTMRRLVQEIRCTIFHVREQRESCCSRHRRGGEGKVVAHFITYFTIFPISLIFASVYNRV